MGSATLKLGEIDVEVILKNIRNIHLSVLPPDGSVRISAPARMSLDTLRVFAVSRLDWIKRQRKKFLEQERETRREHLDRESHFLWGKRYLLQVVELDAAAKIERRPRTILLRIRPGTSEEKKQELLEEWYREQVRAAAQPLIAAWAPRLGVTVSRLYVQHMKTKWGSCNPRLHSIRINTELAKKPPECLEYLVVHEMAHLLEPTHNKRFVALLDRFMPKWKFHRDQLNHLPIRHEQWEY